MALSHVAIDTIWLKLLLEDIGLVQLEAMELKYDNQRCLAFTCNPKHYARIKHINIEYHCKREKIEMRIIHMMYCKP